MRRAPSSQCVADAGLTLIEILVAITLLALLSAGMMTALAMPARARSQARERLTLDRRIATANQLLYAQFAAVTPVLMQAPPAVGAPAAPFFHGEPQQMRFVSSYSIEAGPRGGLSIIELNVQAKNGLRLVLTESPYRGPLSTAVSLSAWSATARLAQECSTRRCVRARIR
ncbi:MAG: prepilin-type N-terminal cleavage/methylation domain-containing protein [Bryobacterales bacterium]